MPEASITVRIRQYSFQVSAPYAKGQRLGEVEVQVLNDLRADNIRNNVTKPVLDAIAALAPGAMLSPEQVAGLQATITHYDSRYNFKLKHEPKPRLSALDLATRAVAEEWLEAQIRSQGLEPGEAEREEAIRRFSELAEIQTEARRRVSVRQQVAAAGLEDLL